MAPWDGSFHHDFGWVDGPRSEKSLGSWGGVCAGWSLLALAHCVWLVVLRAGRGVCCVGVLGCRPDRSEELSQDVDVTRERVDIDGNSKFAKDNACGQIGCVYTISRSAGILCRARTYFL